MYRAKEQRLTREAMKKYLRERGDMVIVMLHAKVRQPVIMSWPEGGREVTVQIDGNKMQTLYVDIFTQ